MALTIDEVTHIARDAARDASPSFHVAGVTLGGGGASDYIEVLVDISGCGTSEELALKLREHEAAHQRRGVEPTPVGKP